MKTSASRRTFLSTCGLGAGALGLRGLFDPRTAGAADERDVPLVIFAYFSGGWDTLLTIDPRDNTRFGRSAGNETGILTAYEDIAANDTAVQDVLTETNGTGLVTPHGSNITFGPAIGELQKHHDKLCLVRGINMGTLSHQVGARYFNTGKVPRALAASGSTLSTVLADRNLDRSDVWLPHLAIGGGESFNEGLSPAASPTSIVSYDALGPLLRPADALGALHSPPAAPLAAYRKADHCLHERMAGSAAFAEFRSSEGTANVLSSGVLWEHFDFRARPLPGSDIARVYELFKIDPDSPAAALRTALGQGAIAAQALANSVSHVIAMRPGFALDTHNINWTTQQLLQRDGLDTISRLIDFLVATEDPMHRNRALWERTTLVCYSEFSRTPHINSEGGRDHHLCNACIVAGPKIRGNKVVGASRDDNYMPEHVDVATGEVVDRSAPNAHQITPQDVHATVLTALGESLEHISNQQPVVLDAMLRP